MSIFTLRLLAQAMSSFRNSHSAEKPSTVADLTAFGIDDSVLAVGRLELWPSERQVFADGKRVKLTRREFEVLLALAVCHGRVVARERLYENVWGRPMPHPRNRSVDTCVHQIRRRLGEAAPGWAYIHTHFGHGYRLEPERTRRGPRKGRTR